MACEFKHHQWWVMGSDDPPPPDQLCMCGAFRYRQFREAFEWQGDMSWWEGEVCG